MVHFKEEKNIQKINLFHHFINFIFLMQLEFTVDLITNLFTDLKIPCVGIFFLLKDVVYKRGRDNFLNLHLVPGIMDDIAGLDTAF